MTPGDLTRATHPETSHTCILYHHDPAETTIRRTGRALLPFLVERASGGRR